MQYFLYLNLGHPNIPVKGLIKGLVKINMKLSINQVCKNVQLSNQLMLSTSQFIKVDQSQLLNELIFVLIQNSVSLLQLNSFYCQL
jgi:hypothetical protein